MHRLEQKIVVIIIIDREGSQLLLKFIDIGIGM